MTHIVWDWNGTLLDDFHLVLEAANGQLTRLGGAPLEMEAYRSRYRRPVRAFNEEVLGRALTDEEWVTLDDGFHADYWGALDRCTLAPGALEALARVRDLGWTQSLLSMAPHEHLAEVAERYAVARFFTRIDGNRGPGGVPKERNLRSHLLAQGLDSDEVWVIGDAVDDAMAAKAVGAGVVLVESGSCHTGAVLAQHARVAKGIPEALTLVEQRVAARAEGARPTA